MVPGATVVEAIQLPHTDDVPQDRAIPQGVRVGTIVAAPIAPAKGAILSPAGTWVALAVKRAKDSPTIRAAAVVVLLGLARGALVFVQAFNAALAGGHHFFQISWLDTLYTAADKTWGFFAAGGGTALLKLWDNNPTGGAAPPATDGISGS